MIYTRSGSEVRIVAIALDGAEPGDMTDVVVIEYDDGGTRNVPAYALVADDGADEIARAIESVR